MANWSMFTEEGNAKVQQIAEQALDLAGRVTDQELWLWCYCRLELLSREKEFAEATDTAVREQLWDWLHEERLLSRDRKIGNWYPMYWYLFENQNTDRYERYVEELLSR